MKKPRPSLYARHRFPAEVISLTVWLYFRFPLSLRMVEEMLAARGILVSHETVRRWAEKFGREFANRIRRRTPRPGDRWHLDEVVITIAGQKHWLWRAVDQDGFVLDVLPESPRPQGRQTPAAQAAEEECHDPAGDGHGQTWIIRRCSPGDGPKHRAPAA